jgi:hypothetical protein
VPERLNEEKGFDVLGDVLETLRFRGSIFFRSELAAPWGMSLAQEAFPRFHISVFGTCLGRPHHRSVDRGAVSATPQLPCQYFLIRGNTSETLQWMVTTVAAFKWSIALAAGLLGLCCIAAMAWRGRTPS